MVSRNPYEDYDPIDPYEDEDETGSFEFVEDEYLSIPDSEGDGLDATKRGGRDVDLTRTMVKARPVSQTVDPRVADADIYRPNQRLRRHNAPAQQQAYHHQQQQQAPRAVSPLPRVPYREDRSQASRPPVVPRDVFPRRRRRHHFLRLAIFIIFIVGIYWAVAHPIDDRLAFPPQEEQTLRGALSLHVPSTPFYVLALGSDAREGETYSRTDTMMLVRVDFWGGKISMLSIPRDTRVEIEGQGTQKINAAYAFGQAGGAVRAVSQLTGARINHVAVVHFEELASLIDYLGGLTVNVPTAVYDPDYTGLYLDEGIQTLDGMTAVLWARTRHGYENGDFGRQENQRLLLTALMNRALSLSPTELPGLIDKLSGLVGTDLRCYNLVPLLIRFKLQQPTIYSASVPYTDTWIDGVSYVEADQEGLSRIMQAMDEGRDPATALE